MRHAPRRKLFTRSVYFSFVCAFWRNQSRDETIIKVNRTLISEDGKQMGSYGTGEVDCTDYWLVKVIDGEPKIICQYENFADTVSELGVYKEFENHEEKGLVN